MKPLVSLIVCLVVCGCASTRHHAAIRTVFRVDPALAAARTTAEFERILASLGARIEGDPAGARTATILIPTTLGGTPPRSVRVIYRTAPDGSLQLESASMLPVLIIEHEMRLTRR